MFPDLEEVAYIADVQWGARAHFSLVPRAEYSKGTPMWAAWILLLWLG